MRNPSRKEARMRPKVGLPQWAGQASPHQLEVTPSWRKRTNPLKAPKAVSIKSLRMVHKTSCHLSFRYLLVQPEKQEHDRIHQRTLQKNNHNKRQRKKKKKHFPKPVYAMHSVQHGPWFAKRSCWCPHPAVPMHHIQGMTVSQRFGHLREEATGFHLREAAC